MSSFFLASILCALFMQFDLKLNLYEQILGNIEQIYNGIEFCLPFWPGLPLPGFPGGPLNGIDALNIMKSVSFFVFISINYFH